MKVVYLVMAATLLMTSSCSSDEPVNPFEESKWPVSDEITLSSVDNKNIAALGDFNDKLMAGAAAESTDGSFCVSPLSVSIYLGMIANSAQGDIRSQIVDAIGCTDLESFNSLSSRLLHYLPSEKNGAVTHVANRVWIANQFTAPKAYVNVMSTVFHADVENVDFTNDQTFDNINRWGSDNTEGLIEEIYPKSTWDLLRNSSMLCANTVYFKGQWLDEFDPALTRQETFHGVTGDITTAMMHREGTMFYAADEKAQMLAVDYKGSVNTFEIYLPNAGIDVRQIATEIDNSECTRLRSKSKLCNVSLSMPSFEMGRQLSLNTIFQTMGLKGLSQADLSPMGINVPGPISTQHQSVIKVDEKGTVLGAITSGNGYLAAGGETVKMNVDRPFMFVVRNRTTNTILMAGVVTRP